MGAELAVAGGAADGADLEGHLRLVHRRLVLPGLAGLQLGDTLLAGVDGSHHVLDGVGDVALVLRHEPLADGAVVLLQLALLVHNSHIGLGGVTDGLSLVRGHFGQVLGLVHGDAGVLLRLLADVIENTHR